METELQQVRDSSSHQKKRIVDMMTNLMKDLSDIGSSIGSEFKVCVGAIRPYEWIMFLLTCVIKN